jgi:hypothetical protein
MFSIIQGNDSTLKKRMLDKGNCLVCFSKERSMLNCQKRQ